MKMLLGERRASSHFARPVLEGLGAEKKQIIADVAIPSAKVRMYLSHDPPKMSRSFFNRRKNSEEAKHRNLLLNPDRGIKVFIDLFGKFCYDQINLDCCPPTTI